MVRVSREIDNIWAKFPAHSILLFYGFGNIGCLSFRDVKSDARNNTEMQRRKSLTLSTFT
jgi:hypothetical protein